MGTDALTNRQRELIKKGRQAEERERTDLIDNCYRAGLIKNYTNVALTTKELKLLYINLNWRGGPLND